MATLQMSVLAEGLHGSAGPVTFCRSRYGTVMRDRTTPRDRRTPGQTASRARMARAGEAWRALDQDQARAWDAYAAQSALAGGAVTGQPVPTGQLVFTRLALRVLQIDATAPVPVAPPAAPFGGDAALVTATASTDGVVFTASGANAAGVVTELLVQPLASVHRRTYTRDYRSQGFVTFTGAGDARTVLLRPGVYATAVRFALAATGQSTAVLASGTVLVA